MENKGYKYQSANRNVNGGPTRGGGSPKDTTGGKSTEGGATNVIVVCGHNPKEYSPSSTSQSRNR